MQKCTIQDCDREATVIPYIRLCAADGTPRHDVQLRATPICDQCADEACVDGPAKGTIYRLVEFLEHTMGDMIEGDISLDHAEFGVVPIAEAATPHRVH